MTAVGSVSTAVAAPVLGVCSLASAFVPYPGGLAGIAGGVAGMVAGVVGIIGARRAAARTMPAMSGIMVSALAIAAGIAMVFIYSGYPGGADGAADKTSAEVLADQLDVSVGTFGDKNPDAKWGRLPVTFTNRLGETAEYAVAIAAFGTDGHQIDSETATVVLAAHSSEDQDMFRFGSPELLEKASFKIIAARKVSRWHR